MPDLNTPLYDARARVILASASPRRRELLLKMGLDCAVHPMEVEEWEAADADPEELVAHNAALKADAATERFSDAPIVAADTTVVLDGQVLNKPADLADAESMLLQLSGQTHEVYTAVSLRWDEQGHRCDFIERSEVTFRELNREVIQQYFSIVNPLDKAGGYGIQEGRDLIIESWTGSIHNIMGLPIERLRNVFEQLGWWEVIVKVDSAREVL